MLTIPLAYRSQIGAFALANAMLAWLLVGAPLNGWFPPAIFFISILVAILYNIRIRTFALRLEKA